MLVLTRLIDQTIVVSGPCTIRILGVQPGHNPRVKVGIDAGADVVVLRGELLQRAKKAATHV